LDLDELKLAMETLMRCSYEIANIPIEEVIDMMVAEPRVEDPPFLSEKNNLMKRVFEECLKVKNLMVEIQPQVNRIKRMEKEPIHRA
jgi:hypothetical protein